MQKFIDGLKKIIADLKAMINKTSNRYKEVNAMNNIKALDNLAEAMDNALKESNQAYSDNKVEIELLDDDVRFSIDSKRGSRYNEFNTLAMQWAYSASTNTGDTKIFNRKGKKFVLLEATDEGYVELASGNYERMKSLERKFERPRNTVYVHTRVFGNAKARNTADNSDTRYSGEYEQSGGQTRGKRLQSDTTGNAEHLRTSDKGMQTEAGLDKSASSISKDIKLSLKVTSEQDVTESERFKQWFGDWQSNPESASKIVNEDGTPKAMYHGTNADFTVFDKKKARSSGLYGKGFYFTDSKSHSATYGDSMAVYLNIRNPLSPNSNTVTKEQIRKFLSAVANNEDYSIENYGTYDVEKVLSRITSRDAFSVIQDINATAIGDFVEAIELFNSVNGTNYDGIVVPTETVAFYPEQIKSATDNIGTFDSKNADIRYSLKETAELDTKKLIKENENLRKANEYLKQEFKLTKGHRLNRQAVESG